MSTTAQHHSAITSRRPGNLLLVWLAVLAVAGAIALVIVLTTNGDDSQPVSAGKTPGAVAQPAGVRFDGGPNEGSRGVAASDPAVRFDGGPNEGTRGVLVAPKLPAPAPEHPLGAAQP